MKMDDTKMDVCILNPPDEQPTKKITKNDLEQIDVFTNVSIEPNGNPILTIGCRLNGLWVPMTLQQPNKWWERLHRLPLRSKLTCDEPKKTITTKSQQKDYADKLSALPKRFKIQPQSINICEEFISKHTIQASGDVYWWDRLSNRLPIRKEIYRQSIYKKYELLLNNLKDEFNKTLKKPKKKKKYANKVKKEAMNELQDMLKIELDESKGSLSLSFQGLSLIKEECEDEINESLNESLEIKQENQEEKEIDNASLNNEDFQRTLQNSIIAVEEFKKEKSNDESTGNKILNDEDEKRQSSIEMEDNMNSGSMEDKSIISGEEIVDNLINEQSFTDNHEESSEKRSNELPADVDMTGLSDLELINDEVQQIEGTEISDNQDELQEEREKEQIAGEEIEQLTEIEEESEVQKTAELEQESEVTEDSDLVREEKEIDAEILDVEKEAELPEGHDKVEGGDEEADLTDEFHDTVGDEIEAEILAEFQDTVEGEETETEFKNSLEVTEKDLEVLDWLQRAEMEGSQNADEESKDNDTQEENEINQKVDLQESRKLANAEKKVRKQNTATTGVVPWWDRLSKPRTRLKSPVHVPLKPLTKFKKKTYVRIQTSDENWINRLSKPRKVAKYSFIKFSPIKMNKRSKLILERKKNKDPTFLNNLNNKMKVEKKVKMENKVEVEKVEEMVEVENEVEVANEEEVKSDQDADV